MNTNPDDSAGDTTAALLDFAPRAAPLSDDRMTSPAFVLGVTGNMDPMPQAGAADPFEHIKQPIRTVFRFLRGVERSRTDFMTLLPHRDFARGLEDWRGMATRTPIIVLSSLAPGADTLVAQVALEDEFVRLNFHVQAPLPFPPEVYRTASTFRPPEASEAKVKELQAVFDGLVARICHKNSEHAFAVWLKADCVMNEVERAGQFAADVTNPVRRRLRYRAAGEYVAVQCDLLLAIWDDDFPGSATEGTGAVVEAKRRGPGSDLLPESMALPWADSGPVFHLHFRRDKCQAKGKQPDPEREGKLRILHPYELGPAELRSRERIGMVWNPNQLPEEELVKLPDDRQAGAGANSVPELNRKQTVPIRLRRDFNEWQEKGNERLTRIVALLAKFNRTAVPTVAAVKREFIRRTGDCSGGLETSMGATLATLYGLCAVQRRAGDENRRLATRKRRGMATLFLLTLTAATLLHLFAHWHPQNLKQQPAAAHASGDAVLHPPNSKLKPEGHAHHGAVRLWLAVAALSCAAAGLLAFWLQCSRRTEEEMHDYRALAEGVRVQIAWCLGGLGRSVPANYMQRQRGELDWIRNAINAVAAPYTRWRNWFQRLRSNVQVEVLKCVYQSWIKEQAEYYRTTSQRRLADLHFFHKLGGVLALAGLAHTPLHILALQTARYHWLDVRSVNCGWVGIALLTVGISLWFFFCGREIRKLAKEDRPKTILQSLAKSGWPGFKRMLLTLVPTPHEPARLGSWERCRNLFTAFLAHIPLSLLVLATVVGLGHWAAASKTWPDAEDLTIVSMGFCFVSGALTVAWAERTLLSEEAYQYNAMASLFGNGGMKMKQLLDDLDVLKITCGHSAEFQHKVAETQELIFSLGREALAENAEWLILHRSRPMEPVMAG